jgi:hypothetical protein
MQGFFWFITMEIKHITKQKQPNRLLETIYKKPSNRTLSRVKREMR